MRRTRLPARLGTRLLLSYVLVSLAAAVSGVGAALLLPSSHDTGLMLAIMHPPRGTSVAQMDAVLAAAVTRAVLAHIAVSLATAIVVSVLFAAYLSQQITGALGRLTAATRRLAGGAYALRVQEEDILEIRALAEDVNRLAATLEEAEERRSLAVASVGHELRTPVAALRALHEALAEGVLEPTPDVLERMGRNIERLERMAASLAAFARAESDRRRMVVQGRVAVGEVLASVARAMEPACRAAGVELLLLPPPAELMAMGEAEALAEVLENLVDNSLAHTPPGGHVRLMAEEVAGTVEVTVRDDGSGIAPEDLPHVFEPFYRGEGGSRGRTPRPGMGLGLAIVERLVAAMGGEVSLESKGKGMGTTARVRLPAAETNP